MTILVSQDNHIRSITLNVNVLLIRNEEENVEGKSFKKGYDELRFQDSFLVGIEPFPQLSDLSVCHGRL